MSPFCHFRNPSFFPKPEKASEAWLAVSSMVSWVDLTTWSMAGEGKERAGETRLWRTSPSQCPQCQSDQGLPPLEAYLRTLWAEGCAWERGSMLRLPALLPTLPSSPIRPFCPTSVA